MTRRRRKNRPVPLRDDVAQNLRWLLGTCLDDRVPLDRLETVTHQDCKQIVTAFMAENPDSIELAIQAVEVFQATAGVTAVLDLLLPELVRYARQSGDFLEDALSPYAGL